MTIPETTGVTTRLDEASSYPQDVVFDEGQHHRAKLGFVLLAMEQTMEDDIFRLAPKGVGVHITRAAMADVVDVHTLAAMGDGIGPASSLLLPELQLDSVAYGCTSGSVVIGDARIEADLAAATGAKRTSTLGGAVLRGLRAVGAQRVSVVTPYLDGINALELEYLEREGFTVDSFVGLGIELDQDIARVRPEFLKEFAAKNTHEDSDALFISCGALRTLDVIHDLEVMTGLPVITSNQAFMWDNLRGAGIEDKLDGYGWLFRDH